MSTVKIRHGHTIIGERIIYNEEPSTIEHAEKLAGRRLDRRKAYCIIKNKVCELLSYVTPCSGCHETEDGHPVGTYDWDPKNQIQLGCGCEECGYSGKRRHSEWVPIDGDYGALEDEEETPTEALDPSSSI